MGYLGRQPTTGIRKRFTYTASANQSSFSGADDNGHVLTYVDGTYVDVTLNGVLLEGSGDDYDAEDGSSIELTSAAANNDVLSARVWDAFAIADHYTKGETDLSFLKSGPPSTSNASADSYTVDLGQDVSDGQSVRVNFTQPNQNTAPVLENLGGTPEGALTLTARNGNPLWEGALDGKHEVQHDATANTWLVVDPTPDSDYTGNIARIATGTYTGDGTTSQSITGIGFAPKYVKIWNRVTADETTLSVIETTGEIIDDNVDGGAVFHTVSPGAEHVFRNNTIISLDSDGFTVDDDGADSDPNSAGEIFNYMAIG